MLQLEMPGRSEPVTIESVKFHQGRPIVGFAGVDTMEAAEALVGAELKVPEAETAAAPGRNVLPARPRRLRGHATRRGRRSGA